MEQQLICSAKESINISILEKIIKTLKSEPSRNLISKANDYGGGQINDLTYRLRELENMKLNLENECHELKVSKSGSENNGNREGVVSAQTDNQNHSDKILEIAQSL
jgi:hypothetical protein